MIKEIKNYKNFLEDLYYGKISEDEAYDIYDHLVEIDNTTIRDNLGMTKMEWTARCNAVPFRVIAKWKMEGWPNKCIATGESIIPENYGWVVKEISDGEFGLCLIKNLKEYKRKNNL